MYISDLSDLPKWKGTKINFLAMSALLNYIIWGNGISGNDNEK
jgi:hypothetical protein